MSEQRVDELIFIDPEIPEKIGDQIAAEMMGGPSPISKRTIVEGIGIFLSNAVGFWVFLAFVGLGRGEAFLVGFLVGVVSSFFWITNRDSSPAARYMGRYVLGGGMDRTSLKLMKRALKAIDVVGESRSNYEGLLDGAANDSVLPQQTWEIARLLVRQSELRAEQLEAEEHLMTDELTAVLGPQRKALARSLRIVTQRIEVLESYAHQVRAADAALEARDRLNDNDKYRELLSYTDDTVAMSELTSQATQVEETLRINLQRALAAGESLAVPMSDASPA